MHRSYCHTFLTLFLSLFLVADVSAQCITVDSVTPYFQDFEASDGSWADGGLSSDWAWGHPNKAIITGAANGQNCWITGGLTGSAYNAGQRSYLLSPCFDFTTLSYPYIEFKTFWETENKYDGNALQYSLNNGTTWQNVGSVGEPVNCLNRNWFNNMSISNLSNLGPNKEGWSGTTQPSNGSCSGGNGSGAWLTASHTLASLAGKPKVIFRFTFGAGTLCNDYDGFAIDDIKISNAPPGNVDFVSGCISNSTVSFTNLSSPCYPTFNWDFGDPASGAANTVSTTNAIHTFSAPGSYLVTLNASGGVGPAIAVAKQIHVIGVNATIANANTCSSHPNNATATAVANADAGVTGLAYSWNTIPVATTPVITGLSAGMYIVTVTATNACAASDTVINPQPLAHVTVKVNATCGNSNGTITITESGGTMPYSYTWSPNVSNGASANNLLPGNYIVSITDNASCSDSVDAQIINVGGVSVVINSKTDVKCFGENTGAATTLVNGTGGTYMYQWLSGFQTYYTPSIQNVAAGIYKLTVTDSTGCTDTATATISEPLPLAIAVSVKPTTCGLINGTAWASVSGGTSPYQYLWTSGSSGDTTRNVAGQVNVVVTDKNGCTQTSALADVKPSQPLVISLGNDLAICAGTRVKLYPGSFASYSWNNSMTDSAINVGQTGIYAVSVVDINGCTATDTVKLSVETCKDIVFPDAFTPDGNNTNDAFGPLGSLIAVSNYTFRIFNRWGQLVFTSNDPFKKWDGKINGAEAGSGVYVWAADYSFDHQAKKSVKGTLLLIK